MSDGPSRNLCDPQGRVIDYLRVSLTDACNLRCVYCMPEDQAFRPARELLTNDELQHMLRLFVDLGFRKFRFTGGEPLLRDKLADLIEYSLRLSRDLELGVTTNGQLLEALARPLALAGLRGVNVNLNAMNPESYARVTRGGEWEKSWRGLQAAHREGLRIKINVVPVRGFNHPEDYAAFVRLTQQNPWQVRFIELMPLGRVAAFQTGHFMPNTEVRALIEQQVGPLQPLGPASQKQCHMLWQVPGGTGSVRFISPASAPFCARCNRARLTADGRLRLCLLQEPEVNLLALLREGVADRVLMDVIARAIATKPARHDLQHHAPGGRAMSEIGG